ncbi:hypothetical protein TRSC58_07365 [Trypanosoma rangeli SC58]|uniref:Uncharacterized protein n=1 Tax=Trypanosoma rangeli SC58 TaxID=429131 RepID=A0A061IVI3_TRYRA|nr:hypothetical protein TRSC58_07365 [Trypanosoma rangeli SC58]
MRIPPSLIFSFCFSSFLCVRVRRCRCTVTFGWGDWNSFAPFFFSVYVSVRVCFSSSFCWNLSCSCFVLLLSFRFSASLLGAAVHNKQIKGKRKTKP